MVENGTIILTKRPVDSAKDSKSGKARRTIWKGLCSIDRGATIIHAIMHGRRINFIDTYNYFRTSVQQIGESIGVLKLPMPSQDVGNDDWLKYCWRDVDIIRLAIEGLMLEWKANDLGNWQATIPSLAFSAYRHRFMHHTIVSHNDREISSMEHDAYVDGRTQAFYLGDIRLPVAGGSVFGSECINSIRPWIDGPAFHYDITSLYPSVMEEERYPSRAICNSDGKPIVWTGMPLSDLQRSIGDYCVVASVNLDTDRDWYPYRDNGHVIYPTGTFNATLCTPEIIAALSHGHIKRINWCILYESAKLFTSWVRYWWDRRKYHISNGDKVRSEVCKVVLNSLAGKFGQRERYWTNDPAVPVDEPWTSWVEFGPRMPEPKSYRSVGYNAQCLQDKGWSRHALVSCAAHINSYARIKMLAYRLLLPDRSVFYIGNDALICNQDAHMELTGRGFVRDNELGYFRLCGVYETASFYGPRDYTADGVPVKSGLPKGAKEEGYRRWEATLLEDADSLLSRPPDGSVHSRRVIIHGFDGRPDGVLTDDGWVRPHRINR